MVYGEELVLPGQPAWAGGQVEHPQPPSNSSGQLQILLRAHSYAEAAKGPLGSLARAEFAYVRRGGVGGPTQPLYDGPFRILDRRPKTFVLDMGGKQESVSVDRLKPHPGTGLVEAARPPRRGRPPGPAVAESLLRIRLAPAL
jgi:hypothetical protein